MGIELTIDESVFDYEKDKITIEVNGQTVDECLDYALKRLPALKEVIFDKNGILNLGIFVKVNYEIMYPDPLVRPIKDGDALEIVYLTGG